MPHTLTAVPPSPYTYITVAGPEREGVKSPENRKKMQPSLNAITTEEKREQTFRCTRNIKIMFK